jgi:PAS domain-containing protein
MTSYSVETLIVFALIAFSTALLSVVILTYFSRRATAPSARNLLLSAENSIVFLFEDEELIDATERARVMLKSRPSGASAWSQFCAVTHARFPTLTSQLARLAREGQMTITSDEADDLSEIRAEWWNGVARIELIHDADSLTDTLIDSHSMNAINNELETLRRTAEMSPYLVWQQTASGVVTWANSAYLALAQEYDETANNAVKTWPPSRIFDTVSLSQGTPEGRAHRVNVTFPNETKKRWYEVFSTTISGESLHFASNANGVVRAEIALRDFVQTLTKTFAHLPTGLAIFDKKRQLALFNPALSELTGLQPMFLSLRPTLFSFLDKLREAQVIPEPKNYKSWRAQMAELEAAAADGSFSETWSLPSGQTYRVTGRPHPDGAVAFLFEDISSEVSLTRRFRSELEASQAVLDSFDEAIAVFAPNGMLTISNTAYAGLWGVDPTVAIEEFSISNAMAQWKSQCEPNPVWDNMRAFVGAQNKREGWKSEVRLLDGRLLPCRVAPLAAGGSLVAFTVPATQKPAVLETVLGETTAPVNVEIAPRKDAPLFKIEA